MTAIFLSYDRDDKERVSRLKRQLEGAGHLVWWDEKIPVGEPLETEISANIAKADCVIVAWSNHSVQSEWVRGEVTLAKERKPLLPVRIDPGVAIPLPFNVLKTANLSNWDFESPHPEFAALLAQIQRLAGTATGSAQLPSATDPKFHNGARPNRKHLWFAALVALPILIGVIGALVAMRWHVPTKIEATLPICSVRMSLPDGDSVPLMDTQTLRNITFEHVARATFAPVEAQPLGASPQEPCWLRSLALGRENVLTGKDFTLVAGRDSDAASAALQAIALVPPGTIVVEKPSGCQSPQGLGGRLRFKLEQPNQIFYVSPVDSLYLDADSARLERTPDASCGAGQIQMQARLADGSPYLEVKGEAKQVAVVLSPLPQSDDIQIFGASGAHLSGVKVARQDDASGRPVAALQGEGIVTYPGFEGRQAARIPENEVVSVSGVIGRLRYDVQADRLSLSLSGEAGTFDGRSHAGVTDYRLTLFDQLWYGHLPAALLTIAAWLAAVTVGAIKLYKDMNR
jgi:hypothetical protein